MGLTPNLPSALLTIQELDVRRNQVFEIKVVLVD